MKEEKTLQNAGTPEAAKKELSQAQAAGQPEKSAGTPPGQKLSPTWAHECIEDLDDWIESQGIYLRQ